MTVRIFISFFLSLFFILVASAGTPATEETKIPATSYNQILWDIQHQMTYASKNETTVLLWTPQKILQQSHESQRLPNLTPYTPNEVLHVYRFDVSMGHNMDPTDIYWRTCEAHLTQVDTSWSQAQVVCDSTPLH